MTKHPASPGAVGAGVQRQRGTTLISMMVGLMLAMIASVALMFSYRSIVLNMTSSTTNARTQSQGAAGSIQLMMLLSQAGWGLGATGSPHGGAANTDLILLSSAALSGNALSGTATTITSNAATGNAVVWDSLVSGSMQCSALLISGGGIQLLGPQSCTAANNWNTMTWTAMSTIATAGTFSGANFAALKTSCWPFGGGPGVQPATQVTLVGASSTSDVFCLTNVSN